MNAQEISLQGKPLSGILIEHHSKSYMHECYYQNESELKIERIQVWICDKTSLTKIVCIFVALFQPSSRSPSVSRLLLLSTIHRKNRTFHDLVPCKLFCFATKSASHIEALCALLLGIRISDEYNGKSAAKHVRFT